MTKIISPLIRSQKNSPSKKVLIILPEDLNSKAKLLRNEINAGITGLNEKIEKVIEQISRRGRLIKRITVVPGGHLTHQESILGTFQTFIDKSTLRILVVFPQIANTSVKKPFSNTILKTNGISHLIQIWYGLPPYGWFEDDEGFSNVKIVIPDKQFKLVFSIIEDIILDIAMFNSFVLDKKKLTDLDFKIDISERKVQFANKLNLPNEYGIQIENIHYFSFASACRNGQSFNINKYIEIWTEFSNQFLSNGVKETVELSSTPLKNTNDRVVISLNDVKEIFRNFKEKGQIPMKDICREINTLSNGSYLLIRIAQKCNRKKQAASVLTYFKGSSYRIGKWRIVPFSEYDKIKRYSPFISIFNFTLK